MALIADVDRRAVAVGAAVALAVTVVMVGGARLADLAGTDWVFALYAVIVGGWAVGGALAARRQPGAPFTHGALAALCAYGLVAVVGVVVRLADGRRLPFFELVFNAIFAATAGIIGGLVATVGTGRPRP